MAEAVRKTQRLARRRPAETAGGGLSAIVAAILALFKVDLDAGQVAAIVVLLGLIPTVVTWWRTR